MLGGYLHSTRFVSTGSSVEMEKEKTEAKKAAGMSFGAPNISLGLSDASTNSTSTVTEAAAAYQNAQMGWEANGGDTTLCSK